MKSCEYYEELISGLTDGEITDEEKAELFEHLETCASCRELYETYSMIFDGHEPLEAPDELLTGVMEKINAVPAPNKGKDSGLKKKKIYLRFAAAAACLILAVFAVPRIFPAGGMKNSISPSDAGFERDAESYEAEDSSAYGDADAYNSPKARDESDESCLPEQSADGNTECEEGSCANYACGDSDYIYMSDAYVNNSAAAPFSVIVISDTLPEYVSDEGAARFDDGSVLIETDEATVSRLLEDGYVFFDEPEQNDASNDTFIIFLP